MSSYVMALRVLWKQYGIYRWFGINGVKISPSILERWRLSLDVELMVLKFRLVYWRDGVCRWM